MTSVGQRHAAHGERSSPETQPRPPAPDPGERSSPWAAYWRTTVTARQAEAPDASYAFTVIVFVPTSNGMAGTLHC